MDNLIDLTLIKINAAEDLLTSLQAFNSINGVQKLHRKIKQELNFLQKIYKSKSIKKEHLQCSNLTHFTALVEVLHTIENCIGVNKPFTLEGRKIIIDIIGDGGLEWIKVVARNPKSLSQISSGNTGYGVRSILDQAEEIVACAQMYPCMFQTPKITFIFAKGIGTNLANKLESLGISLVGRRLDNIDDCDEFEIDTSADLSTTNTSHIPKVNLDVSTLLAYTSSVTNGSCMKYRFDVPVLAQQACWESQRPVKPMLDAFFQDKKLYCCETARDNYRNILYTVGGPNERMRGEEFLKRVTVLPDDSSDAETDQCGNNADIFNSVQFTDDKHLPLGGKIKERSLTIFSFGDRIKAVTVTSNDGFVRAARQQGINFVVFVHESRALTEEKETKATLIDT